MWRFRSLAGWAAVVALAAASMALLGGHGRPSVAAAAQPGCIPARTHVPGTTVASISTADGVRGYRLHVPPSYNGFDRTPLVLNFHGAGASAASQEWYTNFSARADASGFIVAYPEGIGAVFNNIQLPSPQPDDVAFSEALIGELEGSLCIDTARVYAAGFSNGAMMSVRLACSLSERVAAIGAVAGVYYPALSNDADPNETCPDTRPVPLISFHGTFDIVIPFLGGPTSEPALFVPTFRLPIDNTSPTQEDVLSDWAVHNGCSLQRLESVITDPVHLVRYGNCANGADVQLYVIASGAHTWPGAPGTPPGTTKDIVATTRIWEFFRTHAMDGSAESDIDGDTVPDTLDPDNDGDGCADVRELQAAAGSEMRGGLRDPMNRWDFFDTDGNRVVDLTDIFNIAYKYGADANTTGIGEPDGYDVKFDRSNPPPGAAIWALGPPNGVIDLSDIFAAAYQYGHSCL